MKKQVTVLSLVILLSIVFVGCGSAGDEQAVVAEPVIADQDLDTEEKSEEEGTQIITYLGEAYEVPANAERIAISGALESMEDALVLGVEPIGAITVSGEFPEMFADIVGQAESTGEKIQLNLEAILQMQPDVILGVIKFPEETLEQLEKIAPTIPISHIASDWEDNLMLLGELTGKEKEAQEAIDGYYERVAQVKEDMGSQYDDKSIVAIRVRRGNLFIYPEDIFFNAVLHEDLGLPVPELVGAAQAQENVSIEVFSELNPDYIFVQFEESENVDTPDVLNDIQSNPIWQSIEAVQNDNVFINVVDPLAQGGTAWSKINFLEAFVDNLLD
ncbi:bacillibactin-binding protein [Natranaerovirga hydrolytica]|uniref:Bacillibactin-binding protein n=1 Tax=Natranaerovirga hydrolytica TaxID=680378 RepID=A0A4R1MRY5_9FIRM|nr:iron-hydroxamate ABC transporter substrate-binding protein [Natranaerovirga hydrolytica]TCK93329.1 bacillibactin-binding protein [Natranaerovirga hydrolytica]